MELGRFQSWPLQVRPGCYLWTIRRDRSRVPATSALLPRSPPYPLHLLVAPVAESKWPRKTRVAHWGMAASRTHVSVVAARLPVSADMLDSGIHRASEQEDIQVRRECLQLLAGC